MPDEPVQFLDADDCLRKAVECRQKADQPGADRVKMLELAEDWEKWAKIRRRHPANRGDPDSDAEKAKAYPDRANEL